MSETLTLPKEILKTVGAELDYTWNWAPWLAPDADAIATAQITLEEPLTQIGSTVVAGGKVSAVIAGGAAGDQLLAVCKVVTTAGRKDARSILLRLVVR